MFCDKCGAYNADGVRFCTECGAILEQKPDGSVGAEAPNSPAGPETPAAYGTAWTPAPENKPGKSKSGKKKSKLGLILGIIAAVVVVAAVLVALNFNAVANFVLRTVGSPKSYYAYVEYRGIEALKSDAGDAYENVVRRGMTRKEKGSDTALSLELGDTGAQLLQSATGVDFSWLDSVGFNIGTDRDGAKTGMQMDLLLNGKRLLGMDMVVDLEDRELSMRVPELSDDWAGQSLDLPSSSSSGSGLDALSKLMNSLDDLAGALPERETVQTLLSRYLKLAADQVEQVEKSKGTLSAVGVVEDCWILRVTLTESELRSIVRTLAKELPKDEDIRAILKDMERSLDRDDLLDKFTDAMEQAEDNADDISLEDDLIMTIWVDGTGAIRGRRIESGDMELLWAAPEMGDKRGLELSVRDDGGERFSFCGSGSTDGELFRGDYTLRVNKRTIFTIAVTDQKEDALLQGRLSGSYEFTPSRALTDGLGLDAAVAAVVQNMSLRIVLDAAVAEGGRATVELRSGVATLARLSLESSPGTDYTIPEVTESLGITEWSSGMMENGGMTKLLSILMDSDIPLSLLMKLMS